MDCEYRLIFILVMSTLMLCLISIIDRNILIYIISVIVSSIAVIILLIQAPDINSRKALLGLITSVVLLIPLLVTIYPNSCDWVSTFKEEKQYEFFSCTFLIGTLIKIEDNYKFIVHNNTDTKKELIIINDSKMYPICFDNENEDTDDNLDITFILGNKTYVRKEIIHYKVIHRFWNATTNEDVQNIKWYIYLDKLLFNDSIMS